jgi:hypothetical protein
MCKGERVDSLGPLPAKSLLSGPAASGPASAVGSASQQLSRVIQSATVQHKLEIGKPGDRFERQADQIAERVVAAPPAFGRSPIQRQAEEEEEPIQAKLLVQRQAEEEEEPVQEKSLSRRQTEEEEPVQEKCLLQRHAEEEEEAVQAKEDSRGTVGRGLQSQLMGTKGSGNMLSENTRSFMEPRFRRAFGNVRVHTDSNAIQMSKELGAQAFTHSSDVYFNEGKYNPDTSSGKQLLAHELTHTVQQNGAVPLTAPLIQRDSDTLSNLQRLDEMLDEWDIPEEDVINLLGKLSSDEKDKVLSGGYQASISNALNLEEMLKAINNLKINNVKPGLLTKLCWIDAAATATSEIDYSDIRNLVTTAIQGQRDNLKTKVWKSFFTDVCTNETIIEAVKDIKFDIVTQLKWIKEEGGTNYDYSDIKALVTNASQPDKVLKTDEWRDFFVGVCTNETIIEAVKDLEFDFATRIDWIFEEGTSWELVKPVIRSIPDIKIDETVEELEELGKLDMVLLEVPESEYVKLDKLYEFTHDPSRKNKIGKYYFANVPREQVKGMELIDEPGNDIEYPWIDVFDPVDPTRKLYDARLEEGEGYLNRDYWIKTGKWKFGLKPGKKASDGIKKIFEGPTRLECLSITHALLYRTILNTLGTDVFDKRFDHTNLKIDPKPTHPGSYRLYAYLRKVSGITQANKESKIEKGDWVYFKNHPKYRFKHPDGAWSGENAFCMGQYWWGENLYRGFGVNELTDDGMVEKLKEKYDEERTDGEREWLAGKINRAYPGSLPTIPSDAQLDAWITGHPGPVIDNFHTSRFPDEAKMNDIPGLQLSKVVRIKMF